ncbi:MAG TPA: hypothetical protein VK363_02700, partial [Pyrinomonadaceae bacterium]|nr:hypothetical protein [Pyrinomonadaceae bacterium]
MFRSPLGRNPARRARRARRFSLVVGLFMVAASLPLISHGAGQEQQVEVPTSKSQASVEGQANIVKGAEFV